jgi:very-short-patch-repair endonuclease
VVEVNGPIHDRTKEEDRQRAVWLEEQNARVFRVTNAEVDADLDAAVAKILSVARH